MKDFERARELFLAAAALDPAARDAFLDVECGDDPELREQVDALLPYHDRPSPGLEPVSGRQPEKIGPYRILSVLGAGGMGVVYLAEQSSPRRTVALKVMRPGVVAERTLKRFAQEADILGRLTHPGIARIFDAGTDGRGDEAVPYFAMERIEGSPITEFCRAKGLDHREQLDLFMDVCEAIAHAHDHGVIHRDLKPSNILVADEDGRVKVLDFGVARLAENDDAAMSLQTETGQLIGTLPYMSPEQVSGNIRDLDGRSDVYALGVLLYELLAEKLPLDLAALSHLDAARKIRDEDPTSIGDLKPELKGDVETILETALRKDRATRYATVRAFADDVRRFLDDEVIRARPASALYKLKKFSRRNRALVGGTSIAFLALFIALAVSLATLKEKTVLERSQAKEARKAMAINDFFVKKMLAAADPWQLGPNVRVRDILLRAKSEVGGSFPGEPELEAEVRTILGETLANLGSLDDASDVLSRAVELWESAGQFDSDRGLETRGLLGWVTHALDPRNPDVAAELSAVADAMIGRFGPLNERTLNARSHTLTALALETPEAASKIQEILADATGTLGPHHPLTLRVRQFRIDSLITAGSYAEGLEMAKTALSEAMVALGPDAPEVIRIQLSLGHLNVQLGQWEDALALLEAARAAALRTFGAGTSTAIRATRELASLLLETSDFELAERMFREVTDDNATGWGALHPVTLSSQVEHAICLRRMGRLNDAESQVRSVLTIYRETPPDDELDFAEAIDVLGAIHYARKDYELAGVSFRESVDRYESSRGPDHPSTLGAIYNLAAALRASQQFEPAAELFKRILANHRKLYGDFHPDIADDVRSIGRTYSERGLWAEAEPFFREAFEVRKVALPEGTWQIQLSAFELGRVLLRLDRLDEAEPLIIQGIELCPERQVRRRGMREALIELLEKLGRASDAASVRRDLEAATDGS